MTLGEILRQARENHGWTQPEAAAKIGIEQSYLSKLETGKSVPSEEMFEKLASAYALDAAQLSDVLSTQEAEKLKDIRLFRQAVNQNQRQKIQAERRWLLTGFVSLLISGAAFGLSLLAEDSEIKTYSYESHGVLLAGESMGDFFRLLDSVPPTCTNEACLQLRQMQARLAPRADHSVLSFPTDRGGWFIVQQDEGRRFYQRIDDDVTIEKSPLRWALAPAFAFLFSGLASLVIAFRWR